jgi:hypothetical protein
VSYSSFPFPHLSPYRFSKRTGTRLYRWIVETKETLDVLEQPGGGQHDLPSVLP